MHTRFIILSIVLLTTTTLQARSPCERSDFIASLVKTNSLQSLQNIPDIRRNLKGLEGLCVDQIAFREGSHNWKMLLVTHPEAPKGPFWFLPHDNEQSAFSAAIYATQKYGGGFLAVMSNDQRHFEGQDPNRNFGDTPSTAQNCAKQNEPAPKYGKIIFHIIDTYRASSMPYLALHNNTDGGGISILRSTNSTHSYPAHKTISNGQGLRDEDSLVYIAGISKTPNKNKLKKLLKNGLNTRYETVNYANNDCSLSNYVVLNRHTEKYYNIETQHGDLKTQKKMIDILMNILKVNSTIID